MGSYWIRHRLVISAGFIVALAVVIGFLFTSPFVSQQSSEYNAQSIYKNTSIDFIVPEPSFEQVAELSGTNGIESVFPFYSTKAQVSVNGTTRSTMVLLSDQFQNVDITMYSEARLIEKADTSFDNPILVDWQFCYDTSAKIGDTVSLVLGGKNIEYQIYAIYETNSVYEGGAILAQISAAEKDAIAQNSKSNGYSGIYVSAGDYSLCRTYLTTDYRPLGRLKDRDQFDSDESYDIHYHAIMDSGYANEITDFRVKANSLDNKPNSLALWIGAFLAAALLISFNVVMAKRGCEKGYFLKHCIPKGQDVKPYYVISLFFEAILFIVLYAIMLFLTSKSSIQFVPNTVYDMNLVVIPAVAIAAEIVAFIMNNSTLSAIKTIVKAEAEVKAEANTSGNIAEK